MKALSWWKTLFADRDLAGGVLLILAMLLALFLSNSPWAVWYDKLLHVEFGLFLQTVPHSPVELGWHFGKSLLHWINEGLMAIFFLLVGLELKREMLEGQLSQPSHVLLPGAAALGGMLVPALVYFAVVGQWGDASMDRGWAIPSATDIAFSLGILALLGKRAPVSLKLFLSALAVIDDLGAIIIIALFYSSDQLSTLALALGGMAVIGLFVLNRLHVRSLGAYLAMGALLWLCVLGSGVHATLAGVIVALSIPLKNGASGHPPAESPLRMLEHALHPWVAFGVMPLFAFANAGVALHGTSWESFFGPLPLAIALGLFLGKQLGIFGISALLVGMGWASLPPKSRWLELYGVSLLGGIGFTMSLFIGSLAFKQEYAGYMESVRLGVLLGSLLSAVAGYAVLRYALRK